MPTSICALSPLPPHNVVFDVTDAEDSFWERMIQNQSEKGEGFFKSIFLSSTTRNNSDEIPSSLDLWLDMIRDAIQIASRQNAILFDLFMMKLIAPIRV